MTPIGIALVQLLYLVALYVPMKSQKLNLPRGTCLGMGYLAAQALAIGTGYLLDMAGLFSAPRAFWAWLLVCVLLNLCAWPEFRHRVRHRVSRAEAVVYAWLTALGIASAWVHLAAPFRNVALAGIDSYGFVNFYAWILETRRAIHDYPSGFALATSIAPWSIHAYQAARWAPPMVYLAGLTASFGFWRHIGGIRFALFLTILLGTAWFLYPVTAYYPHFIQWTLAYTALPALLVLYSLLAKRASGRLILLGVVLNAMLAMTMAYFALYLNILLVLLSGLQSPWNRWKAKPMGAAILVALIPALTLLLYYGVLAPRFFKAWPVGIDSQSRHVAEVSLAVLDPAPESGPVAAQESPVRPLFWMIGSFLRPANPLRISLRWGVYAGFLVLGLGGWVRSRTARRTALRLLAGLLLFSTFSAMTGMLELPAWEGRNVFIALLSGLCLLLWEAQRIAPGLARKTLSSPWRMGWIALLITGPAILWPPMIGRNVPIADVVLPRAIPHDNVVLAELTRRIDPTEKPRTLTIVTQPRTPLIQNLRRIRRPFYAGIFPGYDIQLVAELDTAFDGDGLLIPLSALDSRSLPEGLRMVTRGSNEVFALRRPTQRP